MIDLNDLNNQNFSYLSTKFFADLNEDFKFISYIQPSSKSKFIECKYIISAQVHFKAITCCSSNLSVIIPVQVACNNKFPLKKDQQFNFPEPIIKPVIETALPSFF